MRLDYLFVPGGFIAQRAGLRRRGRAREAKDASDHFPLCAELEVCCRTMTVADLGSGNVTSMTMILHDGRLRCDVPRFAIG